MMRAGEAFVLVYGAKNLCVSTNARAIARTLVLPSSRLIPLAFWPQVGPCLFLGWTANEGCYPQNATVRVSRADEAAALHKPGLPVGYLFVYSVSAWSSIY